MPVPHEILYQVVCACVILEDGSDLTEKSLRTYCEDVHNDKPGLFTVLPTYYIHVCERIPDLDLPTRLNEDGVRGVHI